MLPLMTSEVFILVKIYQDQLINEYARKKKAKISESHSHGVFLVRYRRTYVVNNVD